MMERIGVWTRYYGPTNHRGSRIKVTWARDSVTIPYDDAESNAHESAVRRACAMEGAPRRSVVSVRRVS